MEEVSFYRTSDEKEQGLDKIILVPGNHGEQFIREKLNLDIKYVVRVSNFIGYMIKEAQRIGYKNLNGRSYR